MLTKQERAALISRAAELAEEGNTKDAQFKRLYDYAAGYLAGRNVSFEDVYNTVKHAIITVEAVLEDLRRDSKKTENDQMMQDDHITSTWLDTH